MTKGTVTTDIVYLPINEVSWLVSRNNNNNNLNRGIPRVPLLVINNYLHQPNSMRELEGSGGL